MSSLSPEDSYLLRHDRFQALLVEVLLVGVYTSIVLFTLHKVGSKCFRRPLIGVMILMYLLAILHVGRIWNSGKKAFVDHGRSEEEILDAFAAVTTAETVISYSSRGFLMLLADCIMIWRCWRLYGNSRSIIVLPVLLFLGELGALIGRIICFAANSNRMALISTTISNNFTTAHLSFTLATTVICTLLIIYRIVRMGGFTRYRSVIEIIVESSALYACAIIIYLPFLYHPVYFDLIPNAVLATIPGISSTLIIARVSTGHGIEHSLAEKSIGIPNARSDTLRFRTTTTTGEETGHGIPNSTSILAGETVSGSAPENYSPGGQGKYLNNEK